VDGEDFTGAYWYKNTHFSVWPTRKDEIHREP
jgi:hypothetical protein